MSPPLRPTASRLHGKRCRSRWNGSARQEEWRGRATMDPENGTLQPCRRSNTVDASWQRGPDGTQNRLYHPCARPFRP